MKFNKQMAIILVLLSLLLSALGSAFYFYKLNEKSIIQNNQLRVICVASKNIDKNTKIQKEHLKKVKIAKKYVLATPLMEKEIIGKYAKVNIYKNDLFRKEKIMNKLGDDVNKTVVDGFKNNSYNIAFNMFKNPNYSVKKGDTIDIISVYPTTPTKFTSSPNAVQYVASQIQILGFLSDGNETAKSINKVTVTKTVKKKKVKQVLNKKADELLIDIDSGVLLSLIDDYNRGNQLWMVKTHKKEKIKVEEEKSIVEVKKIKKPKVGNKSKVKRVYRTKMYKTKSRYENVKATIYYGDDKEASVVKNRKLKVETKCNLTHYLLGISNKVHLRSGSSNRYKIKKIIYKNYIIPFHTMVNEDWFMTCDGYYIHRNEVKLITISDAKKRLAK